MTLPPRTQVFVAEVTTFGLKILGAIAIWIIGRRLIALVVRLTTAAVRRQSIDETLAGYIGSAIAILQFTAAGPQLAVRPYRHTDHHWQVYFDANRAIRETFAGAGYPVPEQLVAVRSGT